MFPHLPSSQLWNTAQIYATGTAGGEWYTCQICAFLCYLTDTVFLDLLTFSWALFWHPLFKEEIHDLQHSVWIRAQDRHEIEAWVRKCDNKSVSHRLWLAAATGWNGGWREEKPGHSYQCSKYHYQCWCCTPELFEFFNKWAMWGNHVGNTGRATVNVAQIRVLSEKKVLYRYILASFISNPVGK